MTALVYAALCGWIAAMVARPFGGERQPVAAAVFCTMFFAAFLLAFHVLGYLELLTGAPLVTTGNAALVLLAVALGVRVAPARRDALQTGSASHSRLPPPGLVSHVAPPAGSLAATSRFMRFAAVADPGMLLRARRHPDSAGAATAAGTSAPGSWRNAVVLLAAATLLLAALMLACGRPQGYEVLAYHLPLSVKLLQTHSLQAWDGNFPHTFPANASILWAVLLEGLPEPLVSAANLLLLAPLLLAVYGLCRLADADRKAALYACCGLAGVPMIAFSSAELGADVGGLAFAALAMYFVLCPLRPAVAMPLAGLCIGLAFGFKSLHLISAVAIGLVACARGGGMADAPRDAAWRGGMAGALRDAAWSRRVAGALRNVARFGGMALLAGGFWLLRNAIAFGNPLHPVGVPLVGAWLGWLPAADFSTALRGATQLEWVDSTWQWLAYPWTEPQRHGQNFKHSSGLGAFVAMAMPATAVALAAAWARDGWRAHRLRLALLFAVAFIVATWWLLGDRQPRYALAALVLAMPLVAWTITQAAGARRRVFDAGLAVGIVAMLAVFLSRQVLQFGDRIVLSKQIARAAFQEYPPAIDALPAGSAILNLADRSWHYPLAGAALSNRVVSMPEARRLLGLPPDLTSPRAVTLQAAPLRTAGITHLFVAGATLSHDRCVRLDEAARLDRNPVNGMPLGSPRVLYAVRYPCR